MTFELSGQSVRVVSPHSDLVLHWESAPPIRAVFADPPVAADVLRQVQPARCGVLVAAEVESSDATLQQVAEAVRRGNPADLLAGVPECVAGVVATEGELLVRCGDGFRVATGRGRDCDALEPGTGRVRSDLFGVDCVMLLSPGAETVDRGTISRAMAMSRTAAELARRICETLDIPRLTRDASVLVLRRIDEGDQKLTLAASQTQRIDESDGGPFDESDDQPAFTAL